jgi:hypothetical protein
VHFVPHRCRSAPGATLALCMKGQPRFGKNFTIVAWSRNSVCLKVATAGRNLRRRGNSRAGIIGSMHITATPPPNPDATLTWVDTSGFWVQVVGVLATTLLALVTVWLTVRSARETARRNDRDQRADWVRSFTDYLNGWVRSSAPTEATRIANVGWHLQYDPLIVDAALLRNEGATLLLDQARVAMRHIKATEKDDVHLSAEDARTQLIQWASDWVHDPKARPSEIIPYIDRYRPGGSEYGTD